MHARVDLVLKQHCGCRKSLLCCWKDPRCHVGLGSCLIARFLTIPKGRSGASRDFADHLGLSFQTTSGLPFLTPTRSCPHLPCPRNTPITIHTMDSPIMSCSYGDSWDSLQEIRGGRSPVCKMPSYVQLPPGAPKCCQIFLTAIKVWSLKGKKTGDIPNALHRVGKFHVESRKQPFLAPRFAGELSLQHCSALKDVQTGANADNWDKHR